jgi:hypothetical protein
MDQKKFHISQPEFRNIIFPVYIDRHQVITVTVTVNRNDIEFDALMTYAEKC